jgi:RNA polymerase sigma-70 factor, ECF subfamily
MPDAGDVTDGELLARLRAGDAAALGPLFDRYEAPVFRYLLGVLHDVTAAEDALQDAFVTALRKGSAADPATFRGWLFTVAHRYALVELRRRKGRPAADEHALVALLGDAGDPAALAEATDTAAAVHRVLDELPAAQRAVIRLRLFEGLRFREVAERLGCPLNTALARMHDGLRNFRALWEARHA